MAANKVNAIENGKGIPQVTSSSKKRDESLRPPAQAKPHQDEPEAEPEAEPQVKHKPQPQAESQAKPQAVNNVNLVKAAFAKQKDMAKEWESMIECKGNGNAAVLQFRIEIAATAGDYKVKHVFILFQKYLDKFDLTKFPVDHKQLVSIQIGGQMYEFKIQKSDRGERQLYILPGENDYQGSDKGISYAEVFEALESIPSIDQREAARYILEASKASINDKRNWTTQFPFLDTQPQQPRRLRNRTMREVLNEIMVVGQVAEAAAPTEEYFVKWMNISDCTTEEVQKAVQQKWEAEVTKTMPAKLQVTLQSKNYSKPLFSLAEELSFPGTQETAKVEVNSLLEVQQKDNNEGLKKPREKAIKAGRKKHESLRKAANLKKEGRVPFADEAFRLTLERISNAKTPGVRWKDYFPHFFPMCTEKGGTEIGRYDIIYSKHIRESIELFNPNYITENLGSL